MRKIKVDKRSKAMPTVQHDFKGLEHRAGATYRPANRPVPNWALEGPDSVHTFNL